MNLVRELCTQTLDGVRLACERGLERIELCDRLDVGGTTPAPTTIRAARSLVDASATGLSSAPILSVMIRPRAGDFVYQMDEIEAMRTAIVDAKSAGADSLVFGCLTSDGRFDLSAMDYLLASADGTPVVFHMAFDEVENQFAAVDDLIQLGIDLVLTHGGPLGEPLNAGRIAEVADYAGKRLTVMIGGGVTMQNCAALAQAAHTNHVHGTKITS